MFILELTGGFPTEKYPMLSCFTADQAYALEKLGNKVVVMTIDLRSIFHKRKYGLKIFEKENIKIYYYSFPIGKIPIFIITKIYVFFAIKIMKKIVIEEGIPEILHAHFCFLQGYAGAVLKKIYGIPLVITEHSSELINKFDESKYKYYAYGYKNANKIIAVGTGLKTAIQTRFNSSAIVIPNIVNLSIFSYKSKEESKTFQFIAVGSLLQGKGFDLLLKAFKQLNDISTNLIIIGDGPEKKSLEQLSKELEIESRVIFTGFLPRIKIKDLISKSHVFILTSRFETFGVVYIEALATGTPIIATRCGGPEDIVNNKNGLLVDVDCIEQTVDAMRIMKDEYYRFNKKQIAYDTKKLYSPETIGKQIISEFEDLV